jgi:hypothetical protein
VDPTFDACLAAFDAVTERSRRAPDRVALFATMYRGVTTEVRRRSGDGTFADPRRMERFVSEFARRYFDAHDAWRSGQPATRSWVTAFEAATRWRPVVLQHLLLGINTHINLDLGIVVAELAGRPEGLPALRPDFEAVNDVLGEMVDSSQAFVDTLSPWFGLADRLGARSDEALIRFSLRRARAQAWAVAERLAALPPEERPAEIDRIDREVDALARRILHPGASLSTGLLVVRLREPWRATKALDAIQRAAAP